MAARAGLADDDARRFWRIFDLLTRESLDFAGPEPGLRFSGICRDGTPWQFCAVIDSRREQPVRFLTEIGPPSSPLRARTALTLARVAEVFDLIGASDHLTTARVLAGLCPPDDDHIAALWVGFAMGAGMKPRVRLYANNGWGEPTERWLRLIQALRALNAGRFGASLQPLIELLLPAFSPAGLALTVPASPLFCKLYLRPIAPPWASVRTLARALLADRAPAYIAAIEDALDQKLDTVPDRALLVSMAGSAAGGLLDLKLDLCGHCLFDDDIRPARTVERLARSLGLDTSSYRAAVEDFGQCGMLLPKDIVAFLGIGASASGENRINVYLTAPAFDRSIASSS